METNKIHSNTYTNLIMPLMQGNRHKPDEDEKNNGNDVHNCLKNSLRSLNFSPLFKNDKTFSERD